MIRETHEATVVGADSPCIAVHAEKDPATPEVSEVMAHLATLCPADHRALLAYVGWSSRDRKGLLTLKDAALANGTSKEGVKRRGRQILNRLQACYADSLQG